MLNKQNVMCCILCLVIASIIVYFVIRKENEGFCGTCQGIGEKVCPNRELLRMLYNTGELTETTKPVSTGKWKTTSWDSFLESQDREQKLVKTEM